MVVSAPGDATGEPDFGLLAPGLWGQCYVFLFYSLMVESSELPIFCGSKTHWNHHAGICLWSPVDWDGTGADGLILA